jgi:hypothetical protein
LRDISEEVGGEFKDNLSLPIVNRHRRSFGNRTGVSDGKLDGPSDDFVHASSLEGVRFTSGGKGQIQGGLFADVGKALMHEDEGRALLGSYGVSFRLAVAPLAVLRLDWGRRFSDDRFQGYSLDRDQRSRSFVRFFFGYNY